MSRSDLKESAKLKDSQLHENAEDDIVYLRAYAKELEEKVLMLEQKISTMKGKRGPSKKKKLAFVHFNDVYHIFPGRDEPVAGLSRVATSIDLLEKSHNPIITCGGDFLSPSLESNLTKGAHMIEALNLLGTRYGILGNHDFDFGVNVLVKRLKSSKTEWLLSNIVDPKTKQPLAGVKKSVLFEWNGAKVGMIGVVENWLDCCAKINPGEAMYLDMVTTAKQLIRELKNQGAELIVALTHNRLDNDRLLAQQVPEIDVILGGHDHTYETFQLNGVTAVKSGMDWEELSVIEISIKPEEKRPVVHFPIGRVPTTSSVAIKPSILTFEDKYRKIMEGKMSKKIAESTEPLDTRESTIRFGESGWANWVVDTCREYNKAQVCILNGGAFRSDTLYPKGPITLGTLHQIFPFEDVILTVELTGQQLFDALENGVGMLPAESGRFSHVSGLKFSYRTTTPREHRVVSVTIGDKPLDLKAKYTVAVNSYVASGKDGYTSLPQGKIIRDAENSSLLQSILRHKLTETPIISPKSDGRITVVA